MARTDTWRHGDPLTMEFAGHTISGTAVVFYRRADNQRFVKVRITSGPRAGNEVWPSEAWVIGRGTHQHQCLDCGHPYRSDDDQPDFCPACLAATTDAAPRSRFDSPRWKREDRGRGRRHF